MGKILTLVIPTYNVELYIRQCLDSFQLEEVMEDIEVLIVNDGSTDRSPEIARDYVDRHPQTYRLIDKINGGHGSTINRGIEEACGKYFKVVDGDDWVDREAFINLVSYLKEADTDLVFSNYCWVDHQSGERKAEVEEICPGVIYKKAYCFQDVASKIFLKMHAITVKTALLKKMEDRLDEHCFYVDMEYLVFPLPHVKTVSFIENFVYQYRIGLPTQSMNIRNMQARCAQHERVLNRLLDFYSLHRGDDCGDYMARIIARVVTSQYKIYLSLGAANKKDLVALDSMIKKRYPTIYGAVTNRAVKALRMSGYLLYPVASFCVQRILR